MPASDTVGVVIPAYNAAAFLRRTLNSVFSQTCSLKEIIVVDEGSSDGTSLLLKELGDKIVSIRREHPSGGPAVPRNCGIMASRSEWIAFLDHDDEWTPDHLSTLCEQAKKTHADVVFSDSSVESKGHVWPSWLEKIGLRTKLLKAVEDGLVLDAFEHLLVLGNFIMPSSLMVRRSCLLEVGLFDERLPGRDDYELLLRLALKFRFAFNPEPTAIRHEHISNLTLESVKLNGQTLALWEKVDQMQEVRGKSALRRVIRRNRAKLFWERGYMTLDSPDTLLSAKRDFSQSFKTWPTPAAAIFWVASCLPFDLLRKLRGLHRNGFEKTT
jgi:teichuronic acid biosynthesis glycosyltransferase TuaG